MHLPIIALLVLLIPPTLSIPATNVTLERLDPTLPPAFTGQKPKCSVLALRQDFAHTVGLPPASANYTHPPGCPAPWTRVVLELSASATAPQKDRIAAVWLDGIELLRTSTPLPVSPGTFWSVHKDVTRYAAALRKLADGGGVITMMLQNSNETLTGVYSVNVTLHFYRGSLGRGYTAFPSVEGLYRDPADLIIPISRPHGYCCAEGFWFRVDNGSHIPAASVSVPRNAYRAVLEIFPSYHGDDETWYTNPLRAEYDAGGHSNGGFRQVYATIDGQFVGGHIPFPVIYPGSINPYFWSPVSAIGAFDMPSYDLDITPFLGAMLDGQPHEIGIGVKYACKFWLVTGNLHVWVDDWSDATEGGLMSYSAPEVKMNRHAEWRERDGGSEVDGEGLVKFAGWVKSSKGNVTTVVRMKIKFKSQVEVQNRGAVRQVEMINKERVTIGQTNERHQILGRVQLFTESPLQIQYSTVNAIGGATFQKTRLTHQLQMLLNLNDNQVVTSSALTDRQDAEGSALMHDSSPVWGSGSTRSYYKYRGDGTCYLRTVNTAGGVVTTDNASPSCSAVADI